MSISEASILPLSGIRVVELTDSKNQLCGKLLADLGAEVILVEDPGGCPARRIGPFREGFLEPENSLYFTYFNTNKKGVTLDLSEGLGRNRLHRLLMTSDVFIESTAPDTLLQWGFDYPSIAASNPGLVMASISSFGQTGPFRHYKLPDPVAYAMGGQMSLTGQAHREPVVPPVELVYPMASLLCAFGILCAVYWRERSGRGQYIDASVYESLAGPMHQLTNYGAFSMIQQRQGNRHPTARGAPYGTFPTRDGRYVHIVVLGGPHWKNFLDWMGKPELLSDPIWEDAEFRNINADVVDMAVEEFTLQHDMEELRREGAAKHLMVSPVASPAEFLGDRQTQSREYLLEVGNSLWGNYPYPRPPFLARTPMWQIKRGSPLLGQHNEEILSALPEADSTTSTTVKRNPLELSPSRPLEGVRILDFTHALAGPLAVQWLEQFGAEVLKVESVHQTIQQRPRAEGSPEGRARSLVTFSEHAIGKRSLQVNMGTEEGRELIRELAQVSDVVVANFSAGVLERWGVDYDTLRKRNPTIVMAALSGFGQTGPSRGYPSIAPTSMAVSGLFFNWRYPDDPEPVAPPIWAGDYVASAYLASTVVAALFRRQGTGRGEFIDISQAETSASLLGPIILDILLNETPKEDGATGEQFPIWAPNEAYRCQGDDHWCVITVTSEDEWQSFCLAVGHPEWMQDKRFDTPIRRKRNHSDLRLLIESWTAQYTPYQVMRILQGTGVPAGVVQTGEDLYRCPQLRERRFVHVMNVEEVGEVEIPGCRIRLSESPGQLGEYPTLGEANSFVFNTVLGLSSSQVADLGAKGVFE